MRKILSLVLIAITSITISCSNDDNGTGGGIDYGNGNGNGNGNSNTKIIGTWGTEWNDGSGIAVHRKFTFLNNGNVKYYTYFSGSTPHLEEIGTWTISGDKIIMDFPETVDIKFKNKITFINNIEFMLEEIEEIGFDTWHEDIYYKTTDPNLN